MKKIVIIVDGYSTGRFLSREFSKHGLSCWHVESCEKKPAGWKGQFLPDDYIGHYKWQGDFSLLQQTLSKDVKVLAVLAGSEPGVELADLLANQFKVVGNSVDTSLLRRNKAAMAKALRLAGVRAIQDAVVENLEQAASWLQEYDHYPVVVKPIDSAGTDGFHLCHDSDQAMQAVKTLLGCINLLGKINQQILLQEYIPGMEYIVNTVSLDGKHYFIDAWQSKKQEINGSRIYDCETLLSPLDPVVKNTLLPYLRRALSALDVQYGPCHNELFIDSHGAVLIESGARLHGAISPDAVRHATGWCHLDAVVELVVNPQKFILTCQKREGQPLPNHALCVEHIIHKPGTICKNAIELIRKLPSCFSSYWSVNEDENVNVTRDLVSSPGNSYLIHHDPFYLEEDYRLLRQIEKDSLIIGKSAAENG